VTLTGTPAVQIFRDRAVLGASAAADVAAELRGRLDTQERVRVVFAAAPSQQHMLEALAAEPGIDWDRVTAFHMDEYLDLPEGAPQRFGRWLTDTLFHRVPLGRVHLIRTDDDPDGRAAEYAALLAEARVDVACLGIGVNGHLAFNDPHVADLDDPLDVKVVELDRVCRQQQVDDGCFDRFEDVPRRAITLTVPRLLAADRLFCVVSGAAKSEAVRRSLRDAVSAACPATALRTHPACTMYLDREAARDLD
jgi:glucosamine-6-phosphate deaminase